MLTLPGCNLQLVAKDGVYLQTAPRRISAVYLSPGSRADVVVTCATPGKHCIDAMLDAVLH